MWDFLDKLYHVLFARWLYSDAMHDYLSGYGPEGDDTIYLNKCVLFKFSVLQGDRPSFVGTCREVVTLRSGCGAFSNDLYGRRLMGSVDDPRYASQQYGI